MRRRRREGSGAFDRAGDVQLLGKARRRCEICKFLNDHIAEVVSEFPLRFVGLGTVPMQDTELAITELERCKEIGLAGVQIGTNVNQLNLGEPQFFDFFAACEELGMAVFVHPWDMMGEKDMQKYWLPWLVGMPAEVSRAICSLIFSTCSDRLPSFHISLAPRRQFAPSTHRHMFCIYTGPTRLPHSPQSTMQRPPRSQQPSYTHEPHH